MDDVVGVLGAGVMGAGVAEATAEAGYRVVLVDVSQDALDTARSAIRRSRAARLLLSGGDRSDVLERIAFSTDYRLLRDAHVVVENVTEDVAVKRAAHRRIDELCRGDALVAANTSAIPIAVLAKGTGHPERVVGTDPRHLPPRGEHALCARCCVPSMRQEIGLLFPVRSTGPHRRCRSGRWSRRFPEIAAAAAELRDAVIDGELVALRQGRLDFAAMATPTGSSRSIRFLRGSKRGRARQHVPFDDGCR